jgi:hypothetical protein
VPEPDLKPRLHHLPTGNRIGEDLQYTVEHWATDEVDEALVRLMEKLGRLRIGSCSASARSDLVLPLGSAGAACFHRRSFVLQARWQSTILPPPMT